MIFEHAKQNTVRKVEMRPGSDELALIRAEYGFVYSAEASSIKRWTDGRKCALLLVLIMPLSTFVVFFLRFRFLYIYIVRRKKKHMDEALICGWYVVQGKTHG